MDSNPIQLIFHSKKSFRLIGCIQQLLKIIKINCKNSVAIFVGMPKMRKKISYGDKSSLRIATNCYDFSSTEKIFSTI